MRNEPYMEEHPVTLSAPEMVAKGQALGNLEQELFDLDEARKETTSDFAARIKRVRGRISLTARELRDGAELRPVEVREEYRALQHMVVVVRQDTMNVVRRWPAQDQDRQLPLEVEPDVPDEPDWSPEPLVARKGLEVHRSERRNPTPVTEIEEEVATGVGELAGKPYGES